MILSFILLADVVLLTYFYFERKQEKHEEGEEVGKCEIEQKKKSLLDQLYKYFLIVTFILVTVVAIVFHFASR